MITLYSILVTIAVYIFTLFLSKKYPLPITNPVFLSSGIVICLLLASHITYDEYIPAKRIMTFLLGPATVALAIPIYKNGSLIKKYFAAAFSGMIMGSVVTISIAIILAKMLHFYKILLISLSIKSVTIPVAAEISKIVGGNVSLTAAVVIVTGMIGAMFGPRILSVFKIDHPFARGVAIGTIAHGIGTAEAIREGEVQGAVSGGAMGIAAIITSFIIPYIAPYIF
ncbi:LrgB family protein [Bacillus sp. JJ1764]|uniref:LrgB family protein n=1 Tax=Bacillus sp. JJ1764 TaxID=3122964 RepID=UPI002FFE3F6C